MASVAFTPAQDRHASDPYDLAGPLTFRRFRLVRSSRSLMANGREVEIGGRSFDLLVVLLEARGTVVEKAEIMRKVWPSTLVDESNLRFQMARLRQILGRDRDVIKTIVGRGYLLAVEVEGTAAAFPGRPRAVPADERIRILERENSQLRQALADATIGRLLLVSAADGHRTQG